MKLIIDIDDKRIKGIKLLAKEQDIATPYPTLEQIIASGIPLDDLRAELHETAEMHDDGDYYLRDEWIDEYFDIYKAESEGMDRKTLGEDICECGHHFPKCKYDFCPICGSEFKEERNE